MDNIRISVLLAVKDGEDFLRESINSVLAQEFNDFELLISDDNSKDATQQIITSYKDKRVRYYKQKTALGQFGNFNFLLDHANGVIVQFWSHDDVMKTNCLTTVNDFYLANPSIGMSYCGGANIDEFGNIINPWKKDLTPKILTKKLYAQYSFVYGCLAGSISQVSINRKKIGTKFKFNENFLLCGDFELWTQIADRYDVGFNASCLADIRIHSKQVSLKPKSNFASINEGIPITNLLLSWTGIKNQEQQKLKREIVLIHYFQRTVTLLKNGYFYLFLKAIRLLKREDNLLLLFISWLKFRERTQKEFIAYRNKLSSTIFALK